MDTMETRRYEMLIRVRDFGAAHPDLFPAGSLGRKMFAATATAVEELGQQAATQVSGRGAAREGSSSKAAARAALRGALGAISRTAHALALDTPGLDNKFRLPFTHAGQALLNVGRAFVQDARPLSAEFVAHGLPTTFLRDLEANIQRFDAAIRDHAEGIGTRIAARTAIDAAIGAGLTAIQRLDAIVVNRLRDDPATFAAWERARRVDQPPHARNGAPPSVLPGPPAPLGPPVPPAPPAPPHAGGPATT
ncbi:MAG: hypothetical protein HY047_15415 [Acidobacteria bacterium]|nr:hypothetical protein [Acidobacteriota bacterium]